MNLAQLSMVSKENLPKRNLTRSGNLFWMHCKYTNMEIKQNILIYIYEGQSKNNEPKSLLAIFVAIKSKVIHQKKAQG